MAKLLFRLLTTLILVTLAIQGYATGIYLINEPNDAAVFFGTVLLLTVGFSVGVCLSYLWRAVWK